MKKKDRKLSKRMKKLGLGKKWWIGNKFASKEEYDVAVKSRIE